MGNYLLVHYAEKLIQKLKQDSNYRVDKALSNFDLVLIFWCRFIMVFRGLWWRSRIKESGFPIFVGKGVTTQHAQHIRVGKFVTIEDGIHINALSKRGWRLVIMSQLVDLASLRLLV